MVLLTRGLLMVWFLSSRWSGAVALAPFPAGAASALVINKVGECVKEHLSDYSFFCLMIIYVIH
jgi:hypothetical protein